MSKTEVPWKRGDLGRFQEEEVNRPRFEVLGSHPEKGVALWYGGGPQPLFVPRDEFLKRALKFWNIEVVPPLPGWLELGAVFQLEETHPGKIVQAEVRGRFDRQTVVADVRGHALKVRRMQYNYASCQDQVNQHLVMVPLAVIAEHGSKVMSLLDRLLHEDVFDDEAL